MSINEMGRQVFSYRSAHPSLVRRAATVPAPAGTAAPVTTPRPGGHRRRARWSGRQLHLLAAGVAVLMLLTGGAAYIWDQHVSSPLYTVRAYYDALADRDADQAKLLLAPGYDGNEATDHFLLTSGVLRDPGYHPPRDVRLERVRLDSPESVSNTDKDDAVVVASYAAAGQPYRQELRLIPHDGGWGEHKWRIAAPLLPLEIASETGTPLVAGTLFRPAGKPVLAFPGAYTVELPAQEFVRAAPVMLLAGPTDPVRLQPTLINGAHDEIERQVRAHIDSCVRGTEVEDCPFRDPMDPYAPTIAPRIIKYPTLRVEVGSWGELMVTSAVPGQVEYTPRTSPPTPARVTMDFIVVGRVRLAGDTLAFTRT